jgi:hypothetical protein
MVEYTGGLTGDNTATFASHGVDIDYESGRIVTADYLDVVSAVVVPDDQVQPALG